MAVKRPPSRRPAIPADLDELSQRCEYVGSQVHKDKRSWLGPAMGLVNVSAVPGQVHKDKRSWLGLPRPHRSADPEETATVCPLVSEDDRNTATQWCRIAIRNKQFDPVDWQNGFPRHIWHKDESGQYWKGFLTNSGAGDKPVAQYKGWPISEEEKNEIFG